MSDQNLAFVELCLCPIATSNDSRFLSPHSVLTALRSTSSISHISHWAIKVRDHYYDLSSHNAETENDPCYNGPVSAAEWGQKRFMMPIRRLNVGITTWTDDEIHERAKYLWESKFRQNYSLYFANCQRFAYELFTDIVRDTLGKGFHIPEDMSKKIQEIPRQLDANDTWVITLMEFRKVFGNKMESQKAEQATNLAMGCIISDTLDMVSDYYTKTETERIFIAAGNQVHIAYGKDRKISVLKDLFQQHTH